MGDLLGITIGPRCGMLRGTSATAWYERGCALESSDAGAAMAAYERALAGGPPPGIGASVSNNLGRLIHDAADHDDRRDDRDRRRPRVATADGSSGSSGSSGSGLGHVARGRNLATAESYYRLAVCGDPEVALYWFNLGVSVEDQGRIAEAIAAYERALALDPGLADAHFNVARLYESAARQRGDELLLRRAVRHLVNYRDLGAISALRPDDHFGDESRAEVPANAGTRGVIARAWTTASGATLTPVATIESSNRADDACDAAATRDGTGGATITGGATS